MPSRYVHFEIVGSHLALIPVAVNGMASTFIFDTGIGPNVISESLCKKLHCKKTGTIRDRRMSGQTVTLSTAVIDSLKVGPREQKNVAVAVWDIKDFPPELHGVEGFISPLFFKDIPFTMDFEARTIDLETNESFQAKLSTGQSVPTEVVYKGPSVQLFTQIILPDGTPARVEVDTGSNSVILHERHALRLRPYMQMGKLKKNEGTDETGYHYVRHNGNLRGTIQLRDAAGISQKNLNVLFQKIIYDGLLGTSFLKKYLVTYDLTNHRMIFNHHPPADDDDGDGD